MDVSNEEKLSITLACNCGESFVSNASYKLHQEECFGKAPNQGPKIQCALCQTVLTRKDSLQRHMKRKHPEHVKDDLTCTKKKRQKMWSQRQTSLAFEDSEETSSNMVDSQEKKISNGDLSALRETCEKFDGTGCHVLVLTMDQENDNLTWFAAGLGKKFAKQKPDLLKDFLQFCKDQATEKTENVTQKKERSKGKGPNKKPNVIAKKLRVTKSVSIVKEKTASVVENKQELNETLDKDKHIRKDFKDLWENYIDTPSSDDEIFAMDNDISEEDDLESPGKDSSETKHILKKSVESDHGRSSIIDKKTTLGKDEETSYSYQDDEDKDLDVAEASALGRGKRKVINTFGKVNQSKQQFEERDQCFEEKKQECLNELVKELEKAENAEVSRIRDIFRKKYFKKNAIIYNVSDFNCGKYQCERCGYKFVWKCHLDIHHIKYPHCNPKENFNVTVDDGLQGEVTFKHEETGVNITASLQSLFESQQSVPLQCMLCDSSFRKHSLFKTHLCRHSSSAVFKCNICNHSLKSDVDLSNHLHDHFLCPFECPTCSWRFWTNIYLDKHAQNGCKNISLLSNSFGHIAHQTTKYRCSVCKTEIQGLASFQQHLNNVHPNEAGFECKHCGSVLENIASYEEHLREHLSHYPCPFCERVFPTKTQRCDHIRGHRSKMQENVCHVCGESFNMKRKLDIHIRIHTGENPYKCEEQGCNKTFRSLDGLCQHKWTHNSHSFICDICGRCFKSPSVLNYHRRGHTITYRWPCMYCSEKYKTLFSFKRHLAKVHPEMKEDIYKRTTIKLYQCDICQKMYHDSEDLRNHVNNHKGIKPYKCQFCEKGFSNSSNLKYHEDTHRGVQKIKCDSCSRKFKTKEGLDKHVEKHHTTIVELCNVPTSVTLNPNHLVLM